MEDIFKMATNLANNMSPDEQQNMENIDMEKMISSVTKSVFGMMKDFNVEGTGPSNGNGNVNNSLESGNNASNNVNNDVIVASESSDDDSSALKPKTRDLIFNLNVTLEDLYNGKKKKLNVKRKRVIKERKREKIIEEKKKLIVPISPGMKDEQEIRFKGEADQVPGYSPGDIVINLIESEHEKV